MASFNIDSDSPFNGGPDPAHDLFVTETMAELSARQGRIADAIGIYRRLLAAGPAVDRRARWELRLAALEGAAPASSLPLSPSPPAGSPRVAPLPPLATPSLRMPLLIDRPVRSGQVVYAEGRDLIVLAPVNPGAQLMADGHIHVYAPLRGRAVAGVRGCAQAQIFCQRLEAELVGVDAAYIPADDLPVELLGRPARIWLEEGTGPGQQGAICRIARLIGP